MNYNCNEDLPAGEEFDESPKSKLSWKYPETLLTSNDAVDLITLFNCKIAGLKGVNIRLNLEFPFIEFVINICFIIANSPLKNIFSFIKSSFM